jgi:hypothetical protein
MSDDQSLLSRRNALKCMAYVGAGTLFALSGGVFTPIDLAMAASDKQGAAKLGKPLFVQISIPAISRTCRSRPNSIWHSSCGRSRSRRINCRRCSVSPVSLWRNTRTH